MAKISIQDIAKSIVSRHGLSQQEAERFVTTLFDVINEGLHREKIVKVKGLGTFKVIDVRERESVNVNTGERVVIESHGKITFTPDPVMRDLVNKPFAQFETVVLNEGVDLAEINNVQTADDVDNEETDNSESEDVLAVSYEDTTHDNSLEDNDIQEEVSQINKTLEAEIPNESDEISLDESNVDNEETVENYSQDEADKQIIEPSGDVTAVSESNEKAIKDDSIAASMAQEQVVPTNDAEVETVGEDFADENEGGFITRHKNTFVVLFFIVMVTVAFLLGYYFGRISVEPIIKYRTVKVVEKPANPLIQLDTASRNDTLLNVEENKQTLNIRNTDVSEDNEQVEEPVSKQTGDKSVALKNAQAMVKTGAYRIVGTANTITVKRGETLRKISRFYLGEGMECYIQVHNGIDDIKEGMKLKIPRLELKRKK